MANHQNGIHQKKSLGIIENMRNGIPEESVSGACGCEDFAGVGNDLNGSFPFFFCGDGFKSSFFEEDSTSSLSKTSAGSGRLDAGVRFAPSSWYLIRAGDLLDGEED